MVIDKSVVGTTTKGLRTTILCCCAILFCGCVSSVVPKTCYLDHAYKTQWDIPADANTTWLAVEAEARATPNACIIVRELGDGLLAWREEAPEEWTEIRSQVSFGKPEKCEAVCLTNVLIRPQGTGCSLIIRKIVVGQESISIMGPQDGQNSAAFVKRVLARLDETASIATEGDVR